MPTITDALIDAAARLRDTCDDHLEPFEPAAVILNPLRYAWEPHRLYLERLAPRGEAGEGWQGALWLGMNPGPWGMAQTGVPFGCVPLVKDFLGIQADVQIPENTHPKRPIQGFACERREVSGERLWGTIQEDAGSPEAFRERHFITNYCPLVWQSDTGKNLTPDKLPADRMAPVLEACDAHLEQVVRQVRPAQIIGIGAWAEKCAKRVVNEAGLDVPVGRVLHPSPASPAANRGWAAAARKQLGALGVPLSPPA